VYIARINTDDLADHQTFLIFVFNYLRRDVNIQYEYTGGGVTGTIDAVTFELAKNAIMHYYEATNPDSYIIKIVEDKDKKGLVVSKVIRVYSSNIHLYTLSLYYTSCRVFVNGKLLHSNA
jgi:hypothetical protein